jgi:hypothetical protein
MNHHDADQALRALESLSDEFDYDKTPQYVTRVKDFLASARRYRDANGLPTDSPFLRISSLGELPSDLVDRLTSIANTRKWSPACANACQRFLTYLCFQDEIPEASRAITNIYEPLYQLLLEGGDFYEHHGDICIRDAATVLLREF